MVSFNRVVLSGNLTRDPELRLTQSGVPVCSFSIAVNRVRSKKSEAVDFFKVSAWRELGEAVANYKKKGDPVLVEGHLQYRTWQAQDGAKRTAVDVVANRVQFLSRGISSQQHSEVGASSANVPAAGSTAEGGWGLAKQLQDEGGNTSSEEEDFEDTPSE